jgi:pilus assembly protein CpaE
MADVIKVLIVDDTPGTLDNLQKLLFFEPDIQVVATALNGEEGVKQAKKLAPDVVLMDLHMPVVDGIQATRTLVEEVPGSQVIMISAQGEREYLRRAMTSGASEFLIKPFSGDELIASIHRVYRLEQEKESFLAKSSGQVSTTAVSAPLPEDGTGRRADQGKIFFLYSGKGGVGKSLIAANLAVAIARQATARVALVDLDLQFGDIGMLLNLDASHGITDLIENIGHMDQGFIRQIMVDGPFGLKVLLAPTRPEHADLVMVDHVHRILVELRDMFDYIIVDSNGNLDDINLELLDLADRIILVTSGSIPAIKNTRLALNVFHLLPISPERVVLLLNNPDGYSEFNVENVEANLRFPISVYIPNDTKLAVRSMNRGDPFVASHPDAKVSQRVQQLASTLIAAATNSRRTST